MDAFRYGEERSPIFSWTGKPRNEWEDCPLQESLMNLSLAYGGIPASGSDMHAESPAAKVG